MPEGATASCLFSIATVKDPYGYRGSFSQVIEEVSPEELERRARELFSA